MAGRDRCAGSHTRFRFRFTYMRPQRLTADPLRLGHRLDWTGRIALTYRGDTEFRCGFRAQLRDTALGHC